MRAFTVYEQEMFGKTHFRAVDDGGLLIFGQNHQVDFPSEHEAVTALCNDCRRNHVEEWQIRTHRIDRQANGRRALVTTTKYTPHSKITSTQTT